MQTKKLDTADPSVMLARFSQTRYSLKQNRVKKHYQYFKYLYIIVCLFFDFLAISSE